MNEVETTRLVPLRPQKHEKVSGRVVVEMDEERTADVWQRRTAAKVVAVGKERRSVEVPQILRIRAEDSRVGGDIEEGILRFNHGFCAPHHFMLPASPLGSLPLTQGA